MKSPTDITLRMTLKVRDWVFAVDFTETNIFAGSAEDTIKVQSCVPTPQNGLLMRHGHGIVCLYPTEWAAHEARAWYCALVYSFAVS